MSRAASGYHWSQQISVPIRPGLTSKAWKPRSPGGEVELLVEERVVRDVHLAVKPRHRAVRVEHERAVVVDARRAALEDRRPPPRRPPASRRGRAPRCSARAPSRPARSSRGLPAGRSTASGTSREGRRPRPRGVPPRRPSPRPSPRCRRAARTSTSARGQLEARLRHEAPSAGITYSRPSSSSGRASSSRRTRPITRNAHSVRHTSKWLSTDSAQSDSDVAAGAGRARERRLVDVERQLVEERLAALAPPRSAWRGRRSRARPGSRPRSAQMPSRISWGVEMLSVIASPAGGPGSRR